MPDENSAKSKEPQPNGIDPAKGKSSSFEADASDWQYWQNAFVKGDPDREVDAEAVKQAIVNDRKLKSEPINPEICREFMSTPANDSNGDGDNPDCVPNCEAVVPGAMLGPYRLMEKIGGGGMGDVWRAEETGKVNREVALKMINPDRDYREFRLRFEAECQALALMDHPNIAKLLATGETIERTPYLVMELIHGSTITEYCDAKRLSLGERLELFIVVCEAIQHAHQKRIVHRDIKPANVLIGNYDGKPVPKIVDFGIAKNTGKSFNDKSLHTAFSAIVGTLRYMSPEQAQIGATDIDTRSDIYSLGVLLYELMTKSTPITVEESKGAATEAILRKIRDDDPPVPSKRLAESDDLVQIAESCHTDSTRLPKQVRGDLDWITMRALEKDRNRRYDTANALAMEIRRFLNDEPVLAGPPSRRYRIGKFIRRNRVPVTVAAMIGTLLAVSTVVATLLWLRATDAESKTRAALAEESRQREETRLASVAALKAKELEREQRIRAEASERLAQRHLYAARLSASSRAFDLNSMQSQYELLDATRPEATGGELRGLEWSLLYDRLHRELKRFEGLGVDTKVAALSADGRRIAFADARGFVALWETEDDKCQWETRRFNRPVDALAFAPDGRRLIAAASDGIATILDAATGSVALPLDGHALAVHAVAWSPDGRWIATGGKDNFLKLWDAADGKSKASVQAHPGEVQRVWFSGASARLASLGDDGVLRFWTLPDLKPDAQAALRKVPEGVALSADFGRIAGWNADAKSVSILDLTRGKEVEQIGDFPLRLSDLRFDVSGQRILAVEKNGDIAVLDLGRRRVAAKYRAFASFATFSADGSQIVAVGGDGFTRLFAANEPDLDQFVGHEMVIRVIAYSRDDRLLATGDSGGSICIWDVESKKLVRVLGIHLYERGPPGSPPNDEIVRRGFKGLLGRSMTTPPKGGYTAHSIRSVSTYAGHTSEVFSLAFTPDGKRLVSSGDNSAIVWNLADGTELHRIRYPLATMAIAVSRDGKRAAIASWDGIVRVFSLDDYSELAAFRGHENHVDTVAFHPDGRRIVSGGDDRTVRIWNLDPTIAPRVLVGHSGPVRAVDVSADGTLVVSAGSDSTVRVWRFADGAPVGTMHGHSEGVDRCAFFAGDMRIATYGHSAKDAAIRIWDSQIARELVAFEGPLGECHDMAVAPSGAALALAVGHGIVVWTDSAKQRAPTSGRGKVRPTLEPPFDPKDVAPKVVGYWIADDLPKLVAENRKTTRVAPALATNKLLVVAVSVPRGLLSLSPRQRALLEEAARKRPGKTPLAPAGNIQAFNPKRFRIALKSGESLVASGVCVLERRSWGAEMRAFTSASTSKLNPFDRELLGYVWEVRTEAIAQPFQVVFDDRPPLGSPPKIAEIFLGNDVSDGSGGSRPEGLPDTSILFGK